MNCTTGQHFGGNANPFYKGQGLKGHPGVDIECGYGTPITALAAGLVYSIYPIDHPASDGYTAVFTLCETPLEVFEMSYGHVSEIDCQIGDQVKAGDMIAKEGNHGMVYAGGQLISLAMQAAGDHRGNHRHVQKRPLMKVNHTKLDKHYLQTAQGFYYDGSYYEIYDFENGYNGCIDWQAPMFPRDLFYGAAGYDVYLFQRALVQVGIFKDTDCIGRFGPKTVLAAAQFQRMYGLSPALGYVGPKTRAFLNAKYGPLA